MQAVIGSIVVIGICLGSFCGVMSAEQSTANNIQTILDLNDAESEEV